MSRQFMPSRSASAENRKPTPEGPARGEWIKPHQLRDDKIFVCMRRDRGSAPSSPRPHAGYRSFRRVYCQICPNLARLNKRTASRVPV